MADFHFSVTQIKRSAGQSAIAAAAYRAGEKLFSEIYGEYSDYTRKRGIIETGILLPSFAPKEYENRESLWNAVERAEHHPKAQLAYSFDFSLQNEFPMKENLEIAREFIQKQFVDRGMIADYAVHLPDKGDAVPNSHVHVLCPIRPLNPDGTWGAKQKRVYRLDDAGNRMPDAAGRPQFDAVPTTDWGSAETLERWREAWAEINNEHFAAHGLNVRLDHRSYEKQGVEQIPTVHEGPKVREMERQGIRTEKGDRNRWIRQLNALIRRLKCQLRELTDWITDLKEAAKPEPSVDELLTAHLNQRNAGAWSFVAKNKNLKEHSQMVRYLQEHGITTMEEFTAHARQVKEKADPVQAELQRITKHIQRLDAIEKAFDRYQTAEDGLGDTVKPRLISVGADLDRVLVINDETSPLMLSDERIEKAIQENGVRLLIIDPIQAFLGAGVDMNRANEVRPILKRLGDMAQRTGCAVLLIGHLNKASGTKSTYRGLGSIDIAAAARSVLLIGRPRDEPDIRVLCHDKSSLAPEGPSLAFRLDGENGFQWIGEYDITADDLLSGKSGEDAQSKLERAKNLIIGLLMENGEVSAAEIDRFAAKQKIGERTVRKAKAELRDAGSLGSRKIRQQWFHFLMTKEKPPAPPELPEVSEPPPDRSAGMDRLMMIMGAMGFHLVGTEPIQTISALPEQLPEPQTALLTDGSR